LGDIFISYKSEDRARAARLVRALTDCGLSVWWDQNIGLGDAWRHQIAERLDQARCVLVLWSKLSVGAGGGFVQDEASRAMRHGTYVPVLIDEVEVPLGFGSVQSHSLAGWHGSREAPRFRTLVAHIEAMLGRAEAEPAPHPPAAPIARRRLLIGGTALAAAGLAGLFALSPRARCAVGFCGEPAPATIAVLPFRNLSAAGEADFLAEGLTEELRTTLSRAGAIRVAARTSSNSFAGADVDLRAAADKLGVAWLLDGSVRRAGDKVRVSATLIEADSGFEKWSQSYDRPLDDLLQLQSGIAGAVALALRGNLTAADRAAVARLPTESPAAYEAYLRGRKLVDLASDLETDRAALALFDRAIALDPGFAAAHAGRARTLQAIAGADPDASQLKANQDAALSAAQRAVALDPTLPVALSTLGYILMYGRLDFPAARGPFERARAAAPDDADILIRFGLFHARAGDMRTGLDALERATKLDPLNPRAFRAYALALYAARDFDAAIATMKQGLAINPALSVGHATIGDALVQQGEIDAAIAQYRLQQQAHIRHAGLAIALHEKGDIAGAQKEMAALSAFGDAVSYQRAQVLASWGEADGALAALDRALAVRDAGLPLLRNDPAFDAMRQDSRFIAFQRRLNFA
jgi:TolB-like protein/Tfp pilus assembly protein PilF